MKPSTGETTLVSKFPRKSKAGTLLEPFTIVLFSNGKQTLAFFLVLLPAVVR